MLKKFLILCAAHVSLFAVAQNTTASYYYHEGVKAFHQEKYIQADSLYSLSLLYQPHPNAYFNRAMARQKLRRIKGYFEDLAFAAGMGDKESYALLSKYFEKVDTLRVKVKLVDRDSVEIGFYHVTYSNSKNVEVMEAKFNDRNQILNVIWYTPLSQVDTTAEESAEFAGGIRALTAFIQANVNYPSHARDRGISGKAFVKFVITENGTIERVELLKGVPDCKSCDKEALRVVSIMPRWKPARVDGRLVKMYFNLPFGFIVQD